MLTLENILEGRNKNGGVTYKLDEIKHGATGIIMWPTAYIATLTPSWTFAGQYTLTTIPAAGGTANVTWTLTIVRASDHVQVYSGAVTPTVALSDSTNFGFSSGAWTANSRGRNGISGSSGTTAPTNQPARSCTLTASYTTTYNGVSVSATYQATMTQNKNDAQAGTVSYSNIRLTLSKYKTSGSPAPAYKTTDATVTAKADRSTVYTFDSGLQYTYNEADAIGNSGFSFSAESNWASFSGSSVIVNGRGTDNGNARSQTLTATLSADTTKTATATLYQAANKRSEKSRVLNSYSITLSSGSVGAAQNTIYVYGTANYTVTYQWPSGAPDSTDSDSVSQAPTSISTNPSVGSGNISVANSSITIPANDTGSARSFAVTAGYGGKSGSATVQQAAITYTYDTPIVTISYPTIGAAGGTVYPTISFTQKVRRDGTQVGTISGTLSNGATSGYATNSVDSSNVFFELTTKSGSGVNGTFNSSNCGVTIASRGTTPGDARIAARYIYVKLKCNDQTGDSYDNGGYVTCSQAANTATNIAAVYTAVRIVSLSTTNITDTCLETAVTASVKATWTEAGVKYSAFDDGDATAFTGLTQHNDEAVNGSSSPAVTMRLNNDTDFSNATNQFKVSNLHNTSQKTHSVVAKFGGLTSEAATVKQKADQQSDWLARDYLVSVSLGTSTISASGGQAAISASGSHTKFKKWLSDNTDVSGTVTTGVSDTPTLSLVGLSSSGVFWIDGTALKHRDMTNNETTDKVKVRATNGGQTADTAEVSVANAKSYGTISLTCDTANIPAAGAVITFTASCPITWTSGYNDPGLTTSDFTFAISSYGNQNKRTYSLNGNSLTMGSLGTNLVNSTKTTTITASKTGVGSKPVNITEAKNVVTNNSLVVQWNISGSPISGSGGTARIGVDSAAYVSTYSSGEQSSSSVSPETILDSISASGTGFSYSHASGAEYGQVTATQNPSTTNARSCTLTASYAGSSATTTISQYAYVVVVVTQAYSLQGWVGEPTFGINPYTLDRYVLECGGSILNIYYSSITSGAVGKTFKVRIDVLGEGHDMIGSGTYYCTDTFAVPSSSGTEYESLNGSFSFEPSEVENYSYIRCRFSLEGASGQNLIMAGNYLDLDFYL